MTILYFEETFHNLKCFSGGPVSHPHRPHRTTWFPHSARCERRPRASSSLGSLSSNCCHHLLQPRNMPLTGIKPVTLRSAVQHSNHRVKPSRAWTRSLAPWQEQVNSSQSRAGSARGSCTWCMGSRVGYPSGSQARTPAPSLETCEDP